MTDAYVGEVQLFGFNFAPLNWAFCAGQIMPITQNTPLFSLLGALYGGNGTSTFGLPNLQGQTVCSVGQGPGLTQRDLASETGSMGVTLQTGEIPSHNHPVNLYPQNTVALRHATPLPNDALVSPSFAAFVPANPPSNGVFSAFTLPSMGGQPHENAQPYLALNFCIALQGTFPARP